MFCSNCGKTVREGAKFCGSCGTPVEIPDVATPAIAVPAEAPVPEAENPLTSARPNTTVPAGDVTPEQAPKPVSAKDFVPGNELYTFKLAQKRMGTSMFDANLGTGTLHVYDNGLRFTGVLGASVGSGVLGMIASAVVTATESLYDPNIYPLEQIQELRAGKCAGVFNALIITMKNGDVWVFYPSLPGSSAPKNIVAMLKPYMDKLNG